MIANGRLKLSVLYITKVIYKKILYITKVCTVTKIKEIRREYFMFAI